MRPAVTVYDIARAMEITAPIAYVIIPDFYRVLFEIRKIEEIAIYRTARVTTIGYGLWPCIGSATTFAEKLAHDFYGETNFYKSYADISPALKSASKFSCSRACRFSFHSSCCHGCGEHSCRWTCTRIRCLVEHLYVYERIRFQPSKAPYLHTELMFAMHIYLCP